MTFGKRPEWSGQWATKLSRGREIDQVCSSRLVSEQDIAKSPLPAVPGKWPRRSLVLVLIHPHTGLGNKLSPWILVQVLTWWPPHLWHSRLGADAKRNKKQPLVCGSRSISVSPFLGRASAFTGGIVPGMGAGFGAGQAWVQISALSCVTVASRLVSLGQNPFLWSPKCRGRHSTSLTAWTGTVGAIAQTRLTGGLHEAAASRDLFSFPSLVLPLPLNTFEWLWIPLKKLIQTSKFKIQLNGSRASVKWKQTNKQKNQISWASCWKYTVLRSHLARKRKNTWTWPKLLDEIFYLQDLERTEEHAKLHHRGCNKQIQTVGSSMGPVKQCLQQITRKENGNGDHTHRLKT